MIDPQRITNFERTDAELEEFLLFSVCVAGHNAKSTAAALDRYLGIGSAPITPLEVVRRDLYIHHLPSLLKDAGIGCYNARARTFACIVEKVFLYNLCLRTCSREALQAIPGIGPKTANFFLLHSRRDYRGAALDTHILKYLRDEGVEAVPKSTPSSVKNYKRLEEEFLKRVPPWATVAQHDLEIWRRYANNRVGDLRKSRGTRSETPGTV